MLGPTLSVLFHFHQQPHTLALHIAWYSAGATSENAYRDRAGDINKCCGLDGPVVNQRGRALWWVGAWLLSST